MYNEIRIQNFRGFADLTVAPLQRVNLLVSRSNVGKTAFLEAVTLLVNGQGAVQAFPKAFRNSDHPEQGSEFWVWLFHDRDCSAEISIKSDGDDASKQSVALLCTGPKEKKKSEGFVRVHQFQVEGQQSSLWMRTEPEMAQQNPRLRNLSETNGGAKIFATSPMNPIEEARKYHKVMLKKGGEERIQELLQVIEPRLVKVRPGQVGQQPSIYADIGLSELIPVSQLGQGFSRVLSIYSSLLLSEAKVFLIDEVENGIHYTALEQVWKGLAEIAERENVQVFATTHSWECLRAAAKVFGERDPYDLGVHRLQLVEGKVESKTFDRESLATSIEHGFEVR